MRAEPLENVEGTRIDNVAMRRGMVREAFTVAAMDGVATMHAMDPSGTRQSKDAHQSRNTLMLSHGTARSYWLTLDPNRPDAAVPTTEIPLRWSSGTPATLRGLNTNYRGFGSGPLEFLVTDANARRLKDDLGRSLHNAYEPILASPSSRALFRSTSGFDPHSQQLHKRPK